MKRLKMFFAVVLLLLAIPFWRFVDIVAITSPFHWPLFLTLTAWFSIFIAIPAKLLFEKIKTYVLIVPILIYAAIAWWSPSLSKFQPTSASYNHCGPLTYTGVFYSIRSFLSEAHNDDLEARNQMCWVRKMISQVPEKFRDQREVVRYSKMTERYLLRPQIKYRASLPLIAVLYFKINTSAADMVGVKEIYDSLHFWIDHYTDEISAREYSVWNWPHSNYVQFEYGLVEKNWQALIDNMVIEEGP